MQWLTKLVDEIVADSPEGGEILIESGISPSGNYHMGYLREILTCEAILRELRFRGREARHVHFVDDQDGFRKVPAGLPPEYEKYLGRPLCDMPAPDGSDQSYADYALGPFLASVAALGVDMQAIRSHEKYRSGFFTEAIEVVLDNLAEVRDVLQSVSGRKLGEEWSPIQVNEEGYLKKRPFVSIDKDAKTIKYLDKDDKEQSVKYDAGLVKLDWRLDWPARWWLLGVNVEPFGRDHATKGGSYDTGKALMDKVFKAPAPRPVPYEFINRAGDTKKMSASKGNGIDFSEVVRVLPPEVVRYFVFRSSPDKTLYFDPIAGVTKLIDEYAELLAKPDKTDEEKRLVELSTNGVEPIVSNVPFSHLVASYQSALRDPSKTIEIIERTEHADIAGAQKEIIHKELAFIANWLDEWAPEDVKFDLKDSVETRKFSEDQKRYLSELAAKIESAPKDADGEWFHKAIYEFKDSANLAPKELFTTLYQVLIGKDSGPRAGWFLSMLPRGWLIKRLRLEA
ncbi:MAG TPA: lysine--tRNA ligase [Candidatus Saccharimonadales bacterium]|nr:lysine--tRNA ligase [Candidatus Saccharimonadales bacterium]